ncbi:hypothetical protein PP753_gp09 [Dinoroseobacter phage vB_DshP-R7L]|uniref:Uncharacterized protein n=1 Tax=Dinoroseobacter phage vB_DshP-R7L TaxID=2873349 RepID=A0AAE8XFI5_9CAUD|nr:hypothetical protein PP753_gp09 [Dinoroseobacter phage vB_DshP-R7L]UAT28848.1 hypothetical protein R7L_gp9 [Dinoroseobacter phage vB_DshP-R7L]
MSVQTTYNTWYIRADQAWTAYQDCLDQHEDLLEGVPAEAEEMAVLQLEMKEWRKAAEHAEKQMQQMEECMNMRLPNPLFIPGTPEEIVRNEVFA